MDIKHVDNLVTECRCRLPFAAKTEACCKDAQEQLFITFGMFQRGVHIQRGYGPSNSENGGIPFCRRLC